MWSRIQETSPNYEFSWDAIVVPKFARLVVPGYPHHVTQRGSRRQQTFFSNSDYRAYLDLLACHMAESGTELWAYCLMPNHVHLILLPHNENGLAKLLQRTHSRYARRVNSAHDWRGHLWQERFHSFVMDEQHLLAAVRYVEMNPVRAGLCRRADEWRWSSVHTHLKRISDELVSTEPLYELIANWATYLTDSDSEGSVTEIRKHTKTGRPAGDERFIKKLETMTGRRLTRRKPGPSCKR